MIFHHFVFIIRCKIIRAANYRWQCSDSGIMLSKKITEIPSPPLSSVSPSSRAILLSRKTTSFENRLFAFSDAMPPRAEVRASVCPAAPALCGSLCSRIEHTLSSSFYFTFYPPFVFRQNMEKYDMFSRNWSSIEIAGETFRKPIHILNRIRYLNRIDNINSILIS